MPRSGLVRLALLAGIYIVILAVGLAFAVAVAYINGIPYSETIRALVLEPFSSILNISEIFVRFIAIYTIAIGVAIAYRAGLWNIGGEGQFLVGAVLTLIAAKYIPLVSPALNLSAMMALAVAGGALWALVPAILKAKYGGSEIVTTLMLNIVAASFTLYALDGPIRGQASFGYLISDVLPEELRLPIILQYPQIQEDGTVVWVDTRLSVAIYITLLIAAVAYIVVERSHYGLILETLRRGWDTARYAGVRVYRVVIASMLIAGGLAGLAGFLHVAGVLHRFDSGQIDHGFGYLAILAAVMGKGHIAGTLLASLFFSIVLIGAENLRAETGGAYSLVWAVVGVMMMLIALRELLESRLGLR